MPPKYAQLNDARADRGAEQWEPSGTDGANPFADYSAYEEGLQSQSQFELGYDESGDLANHRNFSSGVHPRPAPEAAGAAEGTEAAEGAESEAVGGIASLPRVVRYNPHHTHTNSQLPYPVDDDSDEDEEAKEWGQWGDEERRFSTRPVSLSAPPVEEPLAGSPQPEDNNEQENGWARRQNLSRLKRAGTRKVGLVQGSVFRSEYPVPSAVRMSILPEYADAESGRTEFSHMRYTAATCDPDDFTPENGYSLRANEYGRETELLVCITYYNEDKVLTARTLYGVMQNIRDICRIKRSAFWGGREEAWKKIQVVLVMDGIDPCDKNVLDVLATIGVYQDGVMKRNVNGEETIAHIFEYTTQLCVLPDQTLVRPEEGNPHSLPPIQVTMCLKQQNTKKINSHRWVFNAFCPLLKPEVVCLIDAGTRPGTRSLFYLWQTFYNDSSVGGACGEIHAMLGPHGRDLLNPIVAAQNFEYKISNILDKPLESTFGYISVLPGAFSAYRYRAVEGRPLAQYFHGDHTLSKRLGKKGVDGMSIFRKNMFLAEDRILCLEVCFKRGEKWHLTYVKQSKAETDVPEGIGELMGQRRRWLNGSFAAGIYGITHFYQVYMSSQNPLRLIGLHLQFCYNLLNQFLTWFNLGCYYLTITIIIELAANPKEYGSENNDHAFPFGVRASSIISLIVKYVYALFVVISFILALGNRPNGSKWMYYCMLAVFGIIQYYGLVIALWLAASELGSLKNMHSISDFFADFFTSTSALVVVALCSTFGLYILTAILYLDPWHVLTSMPQYMFMQPSFVNVLNVYAFCNWHDVSWGTKGSVSLGALPSVKAVKEGDNTVVEEHVLDLEDIDRRFQQVVKRALAPYKPPKESSSITEDDQSRMFRTYLITTWLVSNVVLIWAITSTESQETGMTHSVRQRISYFFAFLLWANAVIAVVRLVGCVVFLTTNLLKRVISRK